MAEKDIIMLSARELKRLHIVHKIFDKKLKQTEASEILNLSTRQISRIIKRVKSEGDSSIVHKSRSRPSNNRTPQKTKDKIIKLYQVKYKGFGPTLLAEKLFEIDKIRISDETLRNWLIERNEWSPGRKYRKHRHWRERKHHFGEMIQLDGSHHGWLEGRGPACVLMGYIDDATNTVFARFYGYEGTWPAMDSFKRYMAKYGIPLSVYLDKHSTYKSTAKQSIENQLNDVESLSHFEKVLKELGVEVIHAQSPQAKGRIERLFKTFQDRLIKEMRLKGIKTIEQANRFLEYYLPIFNKRFNIEPIETGDLHRSVPKTINLDRILCVKTEHPVRNDLTITHDKRLYQIINRTAARKVTVEERLNGRMFIVYEGSALKYKTIAKSQLKPKQYNFKIPTAYIPPPDHPYKRPMFEGRQRLNNYLQEQQEALLTKT